MSGIFKNLIRSIKEKEQCPYNYEFKDNEVHHCLNCNHDFMGNFCPYCSQPADTRRISWQSIMHGFMELWGFCKRSVPSTIWQLIYRPGYLILDYLRGHRVASYPPIKMLVIVALITGLLDHYIIPEDEDTVNVEIEAEAPQTTDGIKTAEQNFFEMLDKAGDWGDRNVGWAMLMICSLLILPTLVLYRRSRNIPKHSLPEGFYIQVLMCPLSLIYSMFSDIHDLFFLLIPFYYYYTYRQLFGYGVWGTSWRLFLCFTVAVIEFLVILIATYVIYVLKE